MRITSRRSRNAITGLAVASALIGVTACTPELEDEATPRPTAPEESEPTPAESVDISAENLEAPWSIAFYDETALVSERDSGRILELTGPDGDDEGGSREIGVIDGVVARDEGGLLGIAADEEHLYAYFTTQEDNRIERHELTGEPGALELGEAETILEGIPAANYHNGGRLAFGPDGMLYATAGDAGNVGTSQDLDSLAGKILRMTPEGAAPDDNPFSGSLVYSYGHRNPQGIGWDEDGAMYSSEFGQDTWDELNVIEAGENYGWPEVEGIAEDERFVDPVQQWEPADASPSGIAIVEESIYIANLRGERLLEVPLSSLDESTEYFVSEYGRLRDVAEAPDGSIWVLTNNTDGRGDPGSGDDRVVRIEPSA